MRATDTLNPDTKLVTIGLDEAHELMTMISEFDHWASIVDPEIPETHRFLWQLGRDCSAAVNNLPTEVFTVEKGIIFLSVNEISTLSTFLTICLQVYGSELTWLKVANLRATIKSFERFTEGSQPGWWNSLSPAFYAKEREEIQADAEIAKKKRSLFPAILLVAVIYVPLVMLALNYLVD